VVSSGTEYRVDILHVVEFLARYFADTIRDDYAAGQLDAQVSSLV
jgi:hypothetical protein